MTKAKYQPAKNCDPLTLGEMIRRERLARGENQEQAGSHFGMTQAAVSRWESFHAIPERRAWKGVADYLGVDVGIVASMAFFADPAREPV